MENLLILKRRFKIASDYVIFRRTRENKHFFSIRSHAKCLPTSRALRVRVFEGLCLLGPQIAVLCKASFEFINYSNGKTCSACWLLGKNLVEQPGFSNPFPGQLNSFQSGFTFCITQKSPMVPERKSDEWIHVCLNFFSVGFSVQHWILSWRNLICKSHNFIHFQNKRSSKKEVREFRNAEIIKMVRNLVFNEKCSTNSSLVEVANPSVFIIYYHILLVTLLITILK